MPVSSQDNLEELSLKLLAILVYSREFSALNCSECTQKESLNCSMDESRTEQVYYNDKLGVSINTCPINCISDGHYKFFDRYLYDTTRKTSELYENAKAWYWRTFKMFEKFKNAITINGGKNG